MSSHLRSTCLNNSVIAPTRSNRSDTSVDIATLPQVYHFLSSDGNSYASPPISITRIAINSPVLQSSTIDHCPFLLAKDYSSYVLADTILKVHICLALMVGVIKGMIEMSRKVELLSKSQREFTCCSTWGYKEFKFSGRYIN